MKPTEKSKAIKSFQLIALQQLLKLASVLKKAEKYLKVELGRRKLDQ